MTNLTDQGGRGGPACPPPGVATTERTSVAPLVRNTSRFQYLNTLRVYPEVQRHSDIQLAIQRRAWMGDPQPNSLALRLPL